MSLGKKERGLKKLRGTDRMKKGRSIGAGVWQAKFA